MPDFFSSPTPPGPTDLRTGAEKNYANVRSNTMAGYFGRPDFGWQDQSAAEDPIYARYANQLKEGVQGTAAEAGFDPLRYGPGVSAIARGLKEMGENRASADIARRQDWMKTVMTGVPSTSQIPYQQPTPGQSPFASLMGPFLGGVGGGVGRLLMG